MGVTVWAREEAKEISFAEQTAVGTKTGEKSQD